MENGPFTADLPLKMVDLSIVFCRFTRTNPRVPLCFFKSNGFRWDSRRLWISKRSTVCCLCCFVFLICYNCYNCYDMLRNSKMCSIKIVLSRQAHTLLTVSIPSLSADFIIMTSQYGRLIMFDHV